MKQALIITTDDKANVQNIYAALDRGLKPGDANMIVVDEKGLKVTVVPGPIGIDALAQKIQSLGFESQVVEMSNIGVEKGSVKFFPQSSGTVSEGASSVSNRKTSASFEVHAVAKPSGAPENEKKQFFPGRQDQKIEIPGKHFERMRWSQTPPNYTNFNVGDKVYWKDKDTYGVIDKIDTNKLTTRIVFKDIGMVMWVPKDLIWQYAKVTSCKESFLQIESAATRAEVFGSANALEMAFELSQVPSDFHEFAQQEVAIKRGAKHLGKYRRAITTGNYTGLSDKEIRKLYRAIREVDVPASLKKEMSSRGFKLQTT